MICLRNYLLGYCLTIVLLAAQPLWAGNPDQTAERVIDSPVAVPVSLLEKMATFRLQPDTGIGVIRYMAELDSGLLRDWLQSIGYLDAKVTVELDEGQAKWRVSAGPLWHVRSVTVVPKPSQSMKLPKQGDIFRSDNYKSAKAKLLLAWQDEGFLKAEFAESVVKPDPVSKSVDINWNVKLNQLFYISEIRITGSRQYDKSLALKLSRLKKGQVPTRQRLYDAMQYIIASSHYQHAIIVPELESAEGNQVPVRITVTETGWRKLTGDAGYSTDGGFSMGAAWVDRSLHHGLLEYNLRAELSRINSGVGATLLKPVWPQANQQAGISLDYNRVDNVGRRYNSISGGPFWQWHFKNNDYLRLTLHGEHVIESGLSVTTVGPRINLHFSRADNIFLPTHGWRSDINLDLPMRVNSPGLWPVIDLHGRYYTRPSPWLLVSPRLGYGRTLNLQGSVPKTYRHFIGGAKSVRGYALDSLGPVSTDGLASGGLMKVYGGLDLVFMPDAKWVSPVLFTDAGKLWQTLGATSATAWSLGAGLILHTPAGPLRLDLAFPQSRRPQDSRYQLYISLGDVL